jgi:hypothetical protein
LMLAKVGGNKARIMLGNSVENKAFPQRSI